MRVQTRAETVEHGACERWQEGRLRGWVKGATSKKVQCCSKGLGPYRSKDFIGNRQTLSAKKLVMSYKVNLGSQVSFRFFFLKYVVFKF